MLIYVKKALRVMTTAFDDQLEALIEAAKLDLKIAGVDVENIADTDNLLRVAVASYCALHFGNCRDYDRVKTSYDEQKAQLRTATGYTDWGDNID